MVKSSIGKGEQGVEDYKRKIIELVRTIDNKKEEEFLRQILLMIQRHLNRG